MPDYKIVLTWESIYDVAEIAEYIEDKFSRQKADEFQKDIEKELPRWPPTQNFIKKPIYYTVDMIFIKRFLSLLLI